MPECNKKQKEIYKGSEQSRCINENSDLFRQVVIDEQCSGCPLLKVRRPRPASCDDKRRDNIITSVLGSQGLSSPDGRVGGGGANSGDGDNLPECPFRFRNSQQDYLCSITNLHVNAEICGKCDKETREQEATFGSKVKHYFGAIRKWVASGMPSRTEEEIKQLFEDHCNVCDRYNKETHSCKSCGCHVNFSSEPLKNKLAMKTESCPLGRF